MLHVSKFIQIFHTGFSFKISSATSRNLFMRLLVIIQWFFQTSLPPSSFKVQDFFSHTSTSIPASLSSYLTSSSCPMLQNFFRHSSIFISASISNYISNASFKLVFQFLASRFLQPLFSICFFFRYHLSNATMFLLHISSLLQPLLNFYFCF